MSIRRRWLQIVFLIMLAGSSSFGGAINPKDIESVIRSMSETQIECSAPAKADENAGEPPV